MSSPCMSPPHVPLAGSNSAMSLFLIALGLGLAIEGTLYAAFPRVAKAMMARALGLPDPVFRLMGVGALALGVVIVALVRLAGGGV